MKSYFKMMTAPILCLSLANAQSVFAADLVQKTAASSPGKEMKMKKGVPTYSISSKSKSIPRLSIGEEATLAADPQALMKQDLKPITLPKVNKDSIPPKISITTMLRTKAKETPKAQSILKVNPDFRAPEVKPLKEIAEPVTKESSPSEKPLDLLTSTEQKMLQALIFLEVHKLYNLAIGLFSEVMQESKVFKQEATLQFASTAQELGLTNDHRTYMIKVLKESGSKDYQRRAAISLSTHALEGDLDLVGILDPYLAELDIDPENADQYQMNRARYYVAKKDLTPALAAIEEIKETSPLYTDGQFMKSIILYRAGKVQESSEIMTKVLAILEQKAPQSELKSVAALTLARQQFQQAQYKEAFQNYLKVSKNNPLWTQAVMEQAWTQIITQDYEGASGNMYSLHTDFFRNTFAPESYIVRAVGYLNLCQFGDGAKAVYSLHHRYSPMKDMLAQYESKNKSDQNYYDTVKKFFQEKDAKVIDGLHRNFIYELVRHPSFMNEQKSLNRAEEQIEKYQQVTLDLLQTEKTILQKQNDLEVKLAALHKGKGKANPQDVKAYEKRISSLKTQYQIAKRARTSIKDIRTTGVAKLETDKQLFKKRASAAVKSRFDEMQAILDKTLDQAELLRYELYSGAGEHLRFQLAGGEITDKEREALKAQDGKALKWDFKGEVWEDELGHYRSSLKNVCPKEEK